MYVCMLACLLPNQVFGIYTFLFKGFFFIMQTCVLFLKRNYILYDIYIRTYMFLYTSLKFCVLKSELPYDMSSHTVSHCTAHNMLSVKLTLQSHDYLMCTHHLLKIYTSSLMIQIYTYIRSYVLYTNLHTMLNYYYYNYTVVQFIDGIIMVS